MPDVYVFICLSLVYTFRASHRDLPLPYLPSSPLGNNAVITKHNRGQSCVAKMVRKSERVRQYEDKRGGGRAAHRNWPHGKQSYGTTVFETKHLFTDTEIHTQTHAIQTSVFLPILFYPVPLGFWCWQTHVPYPIDAQGAVSVRGRVCQGPYPSGHEHAHKLMFVVPNGPCSIKLTLSSLCLQDPWHCSRYPTGGSRDTVC